MKDLKKGDYVILPNGDRQTVSEIYLRNGKLWCVTTNEEIYKISEIKQESDPWRITDIIREGNKINSRERESLIHLICSFEGAINMEKYKDYPDKDLEIEFFNLACDYCR